MKQLRRVAFLLVSIMLVACGALVPGFGGTPTPSELHAKTGEIMTAGNWAVSVTGPLQSEGGIPFIQKIIKNISKVNQVLDLSRIEVTLIDNTGYIVATGITEPENTFISLPPGLKLTFYRFFLSSGQYVMPKFSKIGISPKFAGVNITFDSSVQPITEMTSDEIAIPIGQTGTFGNLQIELLNVSPDPQYDKPIVELGVEQHLKRYRDSVDLLCGCLQSG